MPRRGLAFVSRDSILLSLQWGRSFDAAESGPGAGVTGEPRLLQWGRSFDAAERGGDHLGEPKSIIASMGPQL